MLPDPIRHVIGIVLLIVGLVMIGGTMPATPQGGLPKKYCKYLSPT